MPDHLTSIEPVRKSVTVPAAPQRAFELFTAHIHEWWPLATHSVGIEQAVGIAFGQGVGAAIVETLADGTTSVWGTVTDWEPPRRVAFTWHAGTAEAEATRVEVTFTPDGPGSTVVRLVHSDWERRADGASARDGYDSGWGPIIHRFAEAASTRPEPGAAAAEILLSPGRGLIFGSDPDGGQPGRPEGAPMRHGVVLFSSDRGITPARAARAAEAAGFGCFYVPEHTHIPVRRDSPHPRTGTAELPDDRYLRTLDPWVALSTAAAVTSTIRLGTAVALPAEHDPITLAKTIASLDHLSGGRVELGVGFGWNADELADHGVPPARRRAVLAEYLAAMQALWSQEEASYQGEFVSFAASWAWPKPVQQPRVPVLAGAGGTAKTFGWIARHADGWLTTPGETGLDDKIALLREAWQEAGRAGQPRVTALAGKPDPDLLAHWERVGVTDVAFGMPDRSPDEVIAYLGRLAARLGLAGQGADSVPPG